MSAQCGVRNLAEFPAVQFRGLPSVLPVVLDDLAEGIKQRLPQASWERAEDCRSWRRSRTHSASPELLVPFIIARTAETPAVVSLYFLRACCARPLFATWRTSAGFRL